MIKENYQYIAIDTRPVTKQIQRINYVKINNRMFDLRKGDYDKNCLKHFPTILELLNQNNKVFIYDRGRDLRLFLFECRRLGFEIMFSDLMVINGYDLEKTMYDRTKKSFEKKFGKGKEGVDRLLDEYDIDCSTFESILDFVYDGKEVATSDFMFVKGENDELVYKESYLKGRTASSVDYFLEKVDKYKDSAEYDELARLLKLK